MWSENTHASGDRERGVNLGVQLTEPYMGCDLRPLGALLSTEAPYVLTTYGAGTHPCRLSRADTALNANIEKGQSAPQCGMSERDRVARERLPPSFFR